MGKGLVDNDGKSFEGRTSTHGMPVSQAGASYEKSLTNLGGDISNPFPVFEDVRQYYTNVLDEKHKKAVEWKNKKAAWAEQNGELNKKLEGFYSGKLPHIDFAGVQHKEGQATRAASATLLGLFANNIENMIVASADLANSDKTDGFLKNTKPLPTAIFRCLPACRRFRTDNGCRDEWDSPSRWNYTACGTFFVFRLYETSRTPFMPYGSAGLYIWTHDAFRVGEDGPTHQPVEQEAQIRLLEHLKNHKGLNSMLGSGLLIQPRQ